MIVPERAPATPEVGGLAVSCARHATGRDGRRAGLAFDAHHRCVDPRDLHRGIEDAVHDLREVDRAAELAEEPVPPRFALRPVERLGEILCQLVHLEPHLVDRSHERRVRLGGLSPPPQLQEGQECRHENCDSDQNHRSGHHSCLSSAST